MRLSILGALLLLVLVQKLPAASATVRGKVTILKRLTRPKMALGTYESRGVTVNVDDPVLETELSRTVVYVENESGAKPPPAHAVMNQRKKRFEPEVIVVPVGSTVAFPNNDPIFHNVFSLSGPKKFDLGFYSAGQAREVQFSKPGIVQVYCHLHSNMSAAVVVTPGGHFAKPGPDGRFQLDGLAAGEYRLVVWHKAAGFFRRTIRLRDGEEAALDFVIPVRDQPMSEP